jgi:hemerythrin-like domain-containing protein
MDAKPVDMDKEIKAAVEYLREYNSALPSQVSWMANQHLSLLSRHIEALEKQILSMLADKESAQVTCTECGEKQEREIERRDRAMRYLARKLESQPNLYFTETGWIERAYNAAAMEAANKGDI